MPTCGPETLLARHTSHLTLHKGGWAQLYRTDSGVVVPGVCRVFRNSSKFVCSPSSTLPLRARITRVSLLMIIWVVCAPDTETAEHVGREQALLLQGAWVCPAATFAKTRRQLSR